MKMRMKMIIMIMKIKIKQYLKTIIKGKNDLLDEITDKSKSFEEQIKSLKKREDLKGYWPYNDYDDKELKSKYFKIQLADMSMRLTKSYLNKYLVIHL